MRYVPSIVGIAAAFLSLPLSEECNSLRRLPRNSRGLRRVCSLRLHQPNGWSLSNCSPRFRPTGLDRRTRSTHSLAFPVTEYDQHAYKTLMFSFFVSI